MIKPDVIFKTVRVDYMLVSVVISLLRGIFAFLLTFGLASLLLLFNIRLLLLGMDFEFIAGLLVGLVVFFWSLIRKLLFFSYLSVERSVPELQDILHTSREYRRKDTVFKQQLEQELADAARHSDLSTLLPSKQMLLYVVGIFMLSIVLLGVHNSPRYELPDMQQLLPQFVRDTQDRFDLADDVGDVVVQDDSGLYGEGTDRQTLEQELIRLRLAGGGTGGDEDGNRDLYDQPFDSLYEISNIQAMVEHTDVQRLPPEESLALARAYSLQARELN